MALKIGDAITTDPQRDDIARAIDSGPHEAGWRLELDNSEDDHVEAVAVQGGRFETTYLDRGSRFKATAPVDAATLKTILVKYFDGETDWRDEMDFIAEPSKGGRARAARRISSKPPTWAIVLVAASFLGLPLFISLLPESGPGDHHILAIALIVGGPMLVMVLAMVANKTLQIRRAAQWPQTGGRITRSGVAASHQRRFNETTTVVNRPTIEYEFSANGQKYTGSRIGIGEDSGGANIEATLDRYPVGAIVTVYYDPADPENCVLERALPSFKGVQGCGTTLTSLAAFGYVAYWVVTHFHTVIAPLWATRHGQVVVVAVIVELLSLMAYLGSLIIAKQRAAPWSVANGVIVESRTQSARRGSRQTTYAPVIEYAYGIKGREFRSRRLGPDDQGTDSLIAAEKIAARFPKDSPVRVYYDPADPGDAMLERPATDRPDRIALAIAIASFLTAMFAGGLFRF